MSPKSFMRCPYCHQRPRWKYMGGMWFAQCPLRGVRGWRKYRLKREECCTFCLWTKRMLRREWNRWAQMHARKYRTAVEA